jgi:hypothetical protein
MDHGALARIGPPEHSGGRRREEERVMDEDWKAAVGRLRRFGVVVSVAVVLLAVSVGAQTQDPAAPQSLEEAVARVERAHAGRILSARGEQRGPSVVYRIRVLTPDNEVRDFEIVGAEGARP